MGLQSLAAGFMGHLHVACDTVYNLCNFDYTKKKALSTKNKKVLNVLGLELWA